MSEPALDVLARPPRPRRHGALMLIAWVAAVDAMLLLGALVCDVVGGPLVAGLLAGAQLVAGVLLAALLINRGFAPFDAQNRPIDPFATLLATTLVFGPLLAPLADEGVALLWRGHAVGVAADAAPAHADRALLEVEGAARPDLAGVHERWTAPRGRKEVQTLVRYVATPLVAPGWTPAQPVPAWLIGVEDAPAWSGSRGVVEVLRAGDDRWTSEGWCRRDWFEQAAADAAAKHGLRVADDAPLLAPVGPLEEERAARLGWLVGCVGALDLALLVLVVGSCRALARAAPPPAAADAA